MYQTRQVLLRLFGDKLDVAVIMSFHVEETGRLLKEADVALKNFLVVTTQVTLF
ncbi:hypothetical protein HanPSC8_Chr03g0125211 [Helianthus annuus]|nr:hypothetical protein HanIR_Chr03g0139821 [Helianthus annuus]KAJ0945178.1 hypothetical protein HanPSC8_Chr03g0125211 [Helianthus annuus]